MANLSFRDLRADEIDCRIATVSKDDAGNIKGLSLLLYKDARCDMNILDETVGPYNWQRTHSRDNANCIVSIWDDEKKQWISKEDTGTESNTEAAKGLASDSFKRSCFNWGIGRELYTAPFIWIDKSNISSKYDKFAVQSIEIQDKKIVSLTIFNLSTKKVVYTYGKSKKAESPATTSAPAPEQTPAAIPNEKPVRKVQPTNDQQEKSPNRIKLKEYCVKNNLDQKKIIKECKLNAKSTDDDYAKAYLYAVRLREEQEKPGELPFEV